VGHPAYPYFSFSHACLAGGLGYPSTPISVNNPLAFIGLGGGRRFKLIIPLDLVTELLKSMTYGVLCWASWQNPMTHPWLEMA
jgi:hypothetical protein